MGSMLRSGRREIGFGVLLALAFSLCLLHSGRASAATGVSVRYPAGWNLVSGPAGTVFNSAGTAYSLGAGDAAYVSSSPSAPAAGGRGYWVYFASETAVELNGAGVSNATIDAPAGQWLMIGDPSGVQAAAVSGADTVLVWDATAQTYQTVTQLKVGQGAWAISQDGGPITLKAVGTALVIPPATQIAAHPSITKGETLFADDYSNLVTGRMPVVTTACCSRRYEGGEYVLRVVDPDATAIPNANVPGTFQDSVLSVDARLVGKTTNRYVRVGCRITDAGGYRFVIDAGGRWTLGRTDGDSNTNLETGRSAAIHTDTQSNHIEFACAGNIIEASVNGSLLASLTDATYQSGISRLNVGVYIGGDNDRTAEARFVNLVVYRGTLASSSGTPGSAVPPTTAAAAAAAGFQSVSSPRGYRLELPSDWQRNDTFPYDLNFVSPDHHQAMYIVVANATPTTTAKSACIAFQGQIRAAVGNGVPSPANVNLPVNAAGADSYALCLFGYTDRTNTIYVDYIVTAIRGQTLYTFVLDNAEDYIERNRPQHSHIIDSIQLVTPAAAPAGAEAAFEEDFTAV